MKKGFMKSKGHKPLTTGKYETRLQLEIEIKRGCDDGLCQEDIAAKCGVAQSTVLKVMKYYGWERAK